MLWELHHKAALTASGGSRTLAAVEERGFVAINSICSPRMDLLQIFISLWDRFDSLCFSSYLPILPPQRWWEWTPSFSSDICNFPRGSFKFVFETTHLVNFPAVFCSYLLMSTLLNSSFCPPWIWSALLSLFGAWKAEMVGCSFFSFLVWLHKLSYKLASISLFSWFIHSSFFSIYNSPTGDVAFCSHY